MGASGACIDDFLGLPTTSPDNVRLDPWYPDLTYSAGGDEYGELLDAIRAVQEVAAASRADAATLSAATDALRRSAAILEKSRVPIGCGYSGLRHDLPGRGHPFLVPARITEWTTTRVRAEVTFTAAHVGGRGAVHGGVIPLLFDELLGRLSNTNRPAPARTAYLRTDYRAVTLPHVPYVVDATVDLEEGRKRHLSARLVSPTGEVTAEAEGLFVALRDGAP